MITYSQITVCSGGSNCYCFTAFLIKALTMNSKTWKPEKENDPNVLRRCVLVRYLTTYTTVEHIRYYFKRYGKVDDVKLLNRKDKWFTRCCVVKMRSEDSLREILETDSHLIYISKVKVELFNGISSHQKIDAKGKHILQISGNKEQEEKPACEGLETLFIDIPYSSLQILRYNYILTGEAKIPLLYESDLQKAKDVAARNGLTVIPAPRKSTCAPAKKKRKNSKF